MSPSMNTGTAGVAPSDAGVASAVVNTGQQVGGSIGTSLLTPYRTADGRWIIPAARNARRPHPSPTATPARQAAARYGSLRACAELASRPS